MRTVSKRKKSFQEIVQSAEPLPLSEAVGCIEKFPKVNFDETVELHFKLNVNPKSSDQMVRGTAVLPHGTGRTVRIAVVCKGEDIQKAEELAADFVGGDDLIERIAKGFMDFDCVIATPEMMRELSKLGKVLGPRGMMPSPKAGTVTANIEKAINEIKAGRIEFKSDKQAGMHIGVGKRSFSKEKISENITYILEAIEQAKPSSVKGNLIKTLVLSTTMGPGIKIAS